MSIAQNKVSLFYAILAGGSGERLWPLSRRAKPKQLLPFLHSGSLLEQTVNRIKILAADQQIGIVTTAEYEQQIADILCDKVNFMITEPMARNTTAAITLLALLLYQRDPEAIALIFPADHYIPANELFVSFMHHAIDYALHNPKIVLLGVQPTYAETGYGYIEYAACDSYPAPIVRFHEKPTQEKAQEYIMMSRMLWNTGIICARVAVLLEEIKKYAPIIYETVSDYKQGIGLYDQVPAASFDTAILEQSKNSVVLPANLAWTDVGSLTSYLSVQASHQPLSGEIIAIDAHKNLVNVQDKLVVLIGIDDVCVVQTDDVLLIARRNETDKIKKVLDVLRTSTGQTYL